MIDPYRTFYMWLLKLLYKVSRIAKFEEQALQNALTSDTNCKCWVGASPQTTMLIIHQKVFRNSPWVYDAHDYSILQGKQCRINSVKKHMKKAESGRIPVLTQSCWSSSRIESYLLLAVVRDDKHKVVPTRTPTGPCEIGKVDWMIAHKVEFSLQGSPSPKSHGWSFWLRRPRAVGYGQSLLKTKIILSGMASFASPKGKAQTSP